MDERHLQTFDSIIRFSPYNESMCYNMLPLVQLLIHKDPSRVIDDRTMMMENIQTTIPMKCFRYNSVAVVPYSLKLLICRPAGGWFRPSPLWIVLYPEYRSIVAWCTRADRLRHHVPAHTGFAQIADPSKRESWGPGMRYRGEWGGGARRPPQRVANPRRGRVSLFEEREKPARD